MASFSSIQLRRLHARLDEVAYELTRTRFTHLSAPELWRPAINAFRCGSQLRICVDLAGVAREDIEVLAERRRLIIRGRRPSPEPEARPGEIRQLLALEIDGGSFERRLDLPAAVDPERVTAEQRNGLLWILLPLLAEA